MTFNNRRRVSREYRRNSRFGYRLLTVLLPVLPSVFLHEFLPAACARSRCLPASMEFGAEVVGSYRVTGCRGTLTS